MVGVLEGMVLVLLSLMATFACVVGLGILGIWLTVRRVRRSRMFNRGALMVRAATATHRPGREIGRLRVTLFDSVTATGRVLAEVDAPLVLRNLSTDLTRTAALTDRRLALLAAEPNPDVAAGVLGPLRFAVAELSRSAAEVRGTAWQFATELDEPRLRRLTDEVADQLYGLRAGIAEVQAIRMRAGL
ncbi:hypothetical protein ACSMXN_24165 [Jatrophihabitans sp. DSM 45814]